MNREFLKSQQATLRFVLIGVIVLGMLIPLAMVEGVTEERQSYFDMTLLDVASSWGNAQNLSGPFLLIPEEHRYQAETETGELVWRTRRYQRVYLPARLQLDVAIQHQFRKRSIYEVPVYTAKIQVQGEFAPVDPALLERPNVVVRVDQARIVVGISHTQAISSASQLALDEKTSEFRSGTDQPWIGSGVHALVADYQVVVSQPFQFELQLKGTRQLGFTPIGGSTEVHMTSSWPHPSFNGAYLPDNYQIREDGFSAQWLVHELARDMPGNWRIDQRESPLADSYAWISLFQPVTEYTIVDRAIKYGLLFIALTFLGFLCFEMRTALRFHPVQYGVIGFGLVLFYLALLSLSEHLDFGPAYLIATLILTALMSWYVWTMTAAARLSVSLAGIIASLYGALYVLLQLEAFALLVGTAVLFAGLIALMLTTRSMTTGSAV